MLSLNNFFKGYIEKTSKKDKVCNSHPRTIGRVLLPSLPDQNYTIPQIEKMHSTFIIRKQAIFAVC